MGRRPNKQKHKKGKRAPPRAERGPCRPGLMPSIAAACSSPSAATGALFAEVAEDTSVDPPPKTPVELGTCVVCGAGCAAAPDGRSKLNDAVLLLPVLPLQMP